MTAIDAERRGRRERAAAPLYVYGIVRAGAPRPQEAGVLAEPVEVVERGSVAALVSPVSSERVRAKRRDLLAHSDVLQAAHAHGVVLPLRFGTLFASEDELHSDLLEPRQGELLSLLERFDGLSEMRLRARYHDRERVLGAIVAGDSEIANLREGTRSGGGNDARLLRLGELVARRYEAGRAADESEIVNRLAAVADDVQVDPPEGEAGVAKASFLIRNAKRARFDEQLEAVALGLRHLVELSCLGPLPPHSFVSIGGR